MSARQPDLFAETPAPAATLDPAYAAALRARLHTTLALVQGAAAMPWDDMMTIINEDNSFRRSKDLLPKEEGDALWAAFDVEMDRLYAVMNEGKEMPEDACP